MSISACKQAKKLKIQSNNNVLPMSYTKVIKRKDESCVMYLNCFATMVNNCILLKYVILISNMKSWNEYAAESGETVPENYDVQSQMCFVYESVL